MAKLPTDAVPSFAGRPAGSALTGPAERWNLILRIRQSKMLAMVVGLPLLVVSLGYIAAALTRDPKALDMVLTASPWILAGAASAYGATHISSSAAWIIGLRAGHKAVVVRKALACNLVAQVGKYLPGNVAPFLARAGLTDRYGGRRIDNGKAAVFEIAATIIAGGAIACVTLLLDPAALKIITQVVGAQMPVEIGASMILLALLGLVAATIVFGRLIGNMVMFAMGLGAMAISFGLLGLSFAILTEAFAPGGASTLTAIGIFAVAWLAGYLVLGAPAGLGVRELVLLTWLTPMIGVEPALAATLGHRVLTATVDGLVALCAFVWLTSGKGLK